MAKKIEYGQTWWGKQWLTSLEQIKDESRFATGTAYAQQGAVQDLKINTKCLVEARVALGASMVYQQQLKLMPFSDKQKRQWISLLKEKAHFLSALLNKNIPKELVLLEKTMDQPLLQFSLEDWKMACSCAQQRLPCKHLVAVLLQLSQLMDQNPIDAFKLRGLDLFQVLKKEGIQLDTKLIKGELSLSDFAIDNSIVEAYDISLASKIDFSILNKSWKDYAQLLSDQVLFYQGDIKRVILQKLKKGAGFYQQQNYTDSKYIQLHQVLKQTSDLALVMNADNQLINLFAIQGEKHQALFDPDEVMFGCISLMETVVAGELPQYSDAFIALHTIHRFCLKLLQDQNLIPRLVLGEKGYIVQWIPAYSIQKELAQLVEQLITCCPNHLLLLDDGQLKALKTKEQILNCCHFWISYFLQASMELIPEFSDFNKKVEYVFFSGQATLFESSHEQVSIQQIQAWLAPFYWGQKRYVPVLKVMEKDPDEAKGLFEIKVQVEDREQEKGLYWNWTDFLQQEQFKDSHWSLLQDLDRLKEYYPAIQTIKGTEETICYTAEQFEQFFFEIIPILKMLQIGILLPKSLQQLTRPSLGWSISQKKQKAAKGVSFMNVKNLLEVKWKVQIGEEMIEVLEFLKLLKGRTGLVKYKEQYIHLDPIELDKILAQLQTPPKATIHQIIQAVLCTSCEAKKVEIAPEIEQLFEELRACPDVLPPRTLKATLRPYQQLGYAWMYKNAQLNLGSLIADDMGLGKTLQVISLLLKFKEEGRLEQQQALVVAPTSLLTNWMNELQKFAPMLQAMTYHGARRQLSKDVDVIVTTYGVARLDVRLFNALNCYCLVIDEAQHIKNVQTAQTEAIKSIEATIKIAMSGTPVENRLEEYWSIMDYVNPNYLGALWEFKEEYADPIEKNNDQQKLNAFRVITAPFILRRLKSDASIIQDLPDKIEQNYTAKLQRIQAEVYQQIVQDTLQDLSKFKEDKKKRQSLILQLMGRLKQVCNHPYQYLNTGGKGPEHSGKGQVLMDLLTRIQVHQEKTLIFTQYRKMGNLICEWIQERFGFEPMYLHGGCSRSQRDKMVEAFQKDRQQRIFILSLKAAGTGLNLTAANHVVHYDLWWNPAVEAQATDRAYRIGQKKNVQVYRLITQKTLEEKIDAMIQSKKNLAEMAVSLGERWLGDLSNKELEGLLTIS